MVPDFIERLVDADSVVLFGAVEEGPEAKPTADALARKNFIVVCSRASLLNVLSKASQRSNDYNQGFNKVKHHVSLNPTG